MRKFIIIGIAALALVAFSGCGKTLDQVIDTGKSALDIIKKGYEDVKDDVKDLKDLVEGKDEQK